MYHPDKYHPHNEALGRFCEAFNDVARNAGDLIFIRTSDTENFIEDGEIIYRATNKSILYDFEKRNSYYNTCGFPFLDFGQFERKIKKPDISLSIQCSKDEKCFCIAWHEDFKKETIKYIGSLTGYGNKEHTGKRFTKKFKELNYSEMDQLYQMLLKAFTSNNFNSSCFEI